MSNKSIVGIVLVLASLVALCGFGGYVATTPSGLLHGGLAALTALGGLVAVFGFVSHRIWWKTGGAKSLALVGVATVIAAWGLYWFEYIIQWWLRAQGLGWAAITLGWVGVIVGVIGGVGLLYRAMKSEGNPAWLVGFAVLGLTFVSAPIASIVDYGEGALLQSSLDGESLVKSCSFSVAGNSFEYPVWEEQKTCPLGTGSPATATATQIATWKERGLAPGMSREEIVGRALCAAQQNAALTAVSDATDEVAKLRAIADALGEFDCSVMGDAKSLVKEKGEWSGLKPYAFPLLIGGLLLLALVAGVVEKLASVGKGSASSAGGGH